MIYITCVISDLTLHLKYDFVRPSSIYANNVFVYTTLANHLNLLTFRKFQMFNDSRISLKINTQVPLKRHDYYSRHTDIIP